MFFDPANAFKPKTKSELASEKLVKEKQAEASKKARSSFVDLISDEKYIAVRQLVLGLDKITKQTLLSIDMNDPKRFTIQAEAKVLNDLFVSFENIARNPNI